MGFGLLFIGYFVASLMSVNSYGYLFRLVGFAIILVALRRLQKYNAAFRFPIAAGALMAVCSLLLSISGITSLLYDEMLINTAFLAGDTVKNVLGGIDMALEFLFHGALAYAIKDIARDTGEEKLVFAAVRNFVFLCFYYVLYGIALLPFAFVDDYVRYFSLPVILLYFACIILNLILIFRCYMKICDEADVDMVRKPSRFDFINRLREESDRREEKAVSSTRDYIENRKTAKNRRK